MPWTEQSLFDHVAVALLNQDGPSLDEEGTSCMYRDGKGRKCAIGHGIPDEKYDPGMENNKPLTLLEQFPSLAEEFGAVSVHFLTDLQHAHDCYNGEWPSKAGWEEYITRALTNFAKHYNLTLPKELTQ
jgi:hypothetical protein